jgi:dynein heavy chain
MSSAADKLKELDDLSRLWVHECMRVFFDRLVDGKDQGWFKDCIKTNLKEFFKTSYESVVGDENRILMYADFADSKDTKKPYVEVTDNAALIKVVQSYLVDYNNIEKTQMNLVLFTDANHTATHCWSESAARGGKVSLAWPPSSRSTISSRSR